MKEYNEMVENVLRRRDAYLRQKTVRNRRIAAAASCCCLAAVLGVFAYPRVAAIRGTDGAPFTDTALISQAPAASSGENDTYLMSPAPVPSGSCDTKIVVNRVSPNKAAAGSEIGANDPVRAGAPDKTAEFFCLSVEDFVAIEAPNDYGVNITPTVPTDLKKQEERFGFYHRNDETGETYFEQPWLQYANDDGSRIVCVTPRKAESPFTDGAQRAMSLLDGHEVYFFHVKGEWYDYDEALFWYHDVGFTVFSIGLEQSELVEVVRSLLQ